MNDLKARLPLSETQFLIMTGMMKPAHGYAVMRYVETITDGGITIGPGTMYGTIKKLLRNKLIRRMPGERSDGRRITYCLTVSGRRLLQLESERLIMLAEIAGKTVREIEEQKI